MDSEGERTITVLGSRLGPRASDPLAWELLDAADAVYLTAGDASSIRRARGARVLVATSRILGALRESGVLLDALVGSSTDPSERYGDGDLDPPPRIVVRTSGASGGTLQIGNGEPRPYAAVPPPGPVVDAYGCGDSFAAGLTFALAEGRSAEEAVTFAARCGAAVLTGRGPYAGQLKVQD